MMDPESLLNRLCERNTGGPALLTILFGAGYGSVNTFIAMLAAEKGLFGWIAAIMGVFLLLAVVQYRCKNDAAVVLE